MPYPYRVNDAVRAAREVLVSQNRPKRNGRKPITIRDAAVKHHTSKSAVGRHLRSLKLAGKPAFSDTSVGRPRNLDESEERAVVAYVMWLERCGFPANQSVIEAAANELRASRTPPLHPVGEGWYKRFLEDNPQLQKKKLVRAFDRERAEFEAREVQEVEDFYTNLADVVQRRDIGPSQILNADECGIRIGVVRERLEVVIVRKKRNTKHEIVAFSNRESATMIGAVNAEGYTIPPFMIFKSWPTEGWDVNDLDKNIRFARSETGFSNAEISMDWIRHFNLHSFSATAKARALGINFTDWYGCDEFMRDIDNPDFIWERPYFERPEKEKIWRLLVIDGFTGKTSLEFMKYCLRFDIEIFVLPPHSTHLTQPLDVGVFQLLKLAHQKALRKHIREGFLNFKRSDLVARLQKIIDESFTKHNIINGFERSGIFPPDGTEVIQKLKEKQKSILSQASPAIQSLLPQESRFRDAREISRHIRHNYRERFSSPTREAYSTIDDVLNEAIVLNSFAESHIKNRLDRISAANSRKMRRRRVHPTGLYVNSTTVQQIEEQVATTTQKEQAEELRRQHRTWRQLQKEEDDRLKIEWKKQHKYDINNNGKPIHISFKRWKEWKNKDIQDDVITIAPASREASPATPGNGFYYDTSGSSAQQRFYERLRGATAAGVYRSPLQDMPALPSSDGVEFKLSNTQEDGLLENLVTGESDDSDFNEEVIEVVDLTQEEPNLPPLPPPPVEFERNFSSTYHRIMDTLRPRNTQ